MKLYTFFRSSAAFRVRIALNLKGLQYESVPKHFARNEHRAAEYLALNPQGLIPALAVDGVVLSQSLAIIEYLNDRHPQPPLLPADPIDRARVRSMVLAHRLRDPPAQQPARPELPARRAEAGRRGRRHLVSPLGERGLSRASSSKPGNSLPPDAIVSATPCRSPTSTSCRRCSTRAASRPISPRSRRSSASARTWNRCRRSLLQDPKYSLMPSSRKATPFDGVFEGPWPLRP